MNLEREGHFRENTLTISTGGMRIQVVIGFSKFFHAAQNRSVVDKGFREMFSTQNHGKGANILGTILG